MKGQFVHRDVRILTALVLCRLGDPNPLRRNRLQYVLQLSRFLSILGRLSAIEAATTCGDGLPRYTMLVSPTNGLTSWTELIPEHRSLTYLAMYHYGTWQVRDSVTLYAQVSRNFGQSRSAPLTRSLGARSQTALDCWTTFPSGIVGALVQSYLVVRASAVSFLPFCPSEHPHCRLGYSSLNGDGFGTSSSASQPLPSSPVSLEPCSTSASPFSYAPMSSTRSRLR